MKSFKFVLYMILVIPALFLVSACSGADIPSQDLASVSIKVGYGSKALASESREASLVFKYCIANGSNADRSVAESQWKVLVMSDGCARIDNLKPGSCTISISAWSGSSRLYSGSSSVVLTAGCEKDVVIQLEREDQSSEGTLQIGIRGDCDSLHVSYRNIMTGQSSTLAVSASSASGEKVFSSNSNLPAGSYEVTFTMFRSGVQVGGEVAAVQIPPCGTGVISGTLGTGLMSVDGLDISKTASLDLKRGQSQSFVYKSNGLPVACTWTLDGKTVSQSSVYNFDNTVAGNHLLVCTAGNDTYRCQIKSYVHETLTLYMEDVLDIVADSSNIYYDITLNGQSLLNSANYPIVLSYTTFDKPQSLSDIGATGLTTSLSDISTRKVLVIGANASLTSSYSVGWVNQSVSANSNKVLRAVYIFKDIPNYALYGCTNLFTIWLGDSVSYVGDYAFGYTGVRYQYKLARCPSTTVFSDTAFSRMQ